jgi:hypothetical protein
MKLKLETSEITNPTLQHLEAWVLTLKDHLQEDNPFDSLEELSVQLLVWKDQFIKNNPYESHWGDRIVIRFYLDEVILISDERSGEYIHITQEYEIFSKPDKITDTLVKITAIILLVAGLLAYQISRSQVIYEQPRKEISHE